MDLKEIGNIVDEKIGVKTKIVNVMDIDNFENIEMDSNFMAFEKVVEEVVDLKTESIVIEQKYWQAVIIVKSSLRFCCTLS